MADDEIADSWEDWEDSGELDKKILTAAQVKKQEQKDSTVSTPSQLSEDSSRTQYQPQVRILRRQPDSPGASANNGNKSGVNTRPTKSLEEREAAYAEARLRILGTASADDTDNTDQRPARLAQQLEEVHVSENVVRQPRGPDGGPGFTQRKTKP